METNNLNKLKDMIKNNKAPFVTANGFTRNTDAPHFVNFVLDDPGGIISVGLGYKEEYLHNGELKSAPVIDVWKVDAKSEETYRSDLKTRLDSGKITQDQFNSGINGHFWLEQIEAEIGTAIDASGYKDVKTILDNAQAVDPEKRKILLDTGVAVKRLLIPNWSSAPSNSISPGIIKVK